MVEMLGYIYGIFDAAIITYIIYQLLGVKVSIKKTILIILLIFSIYVITHLLLNEKSILNNNLYIIIIIIVLSLFRISNLFQVFVSTIITINITVMLNDIFLNSLITFMNIAMSTLYYKPLAYSLVSIGFLVFKIIFLALLKHFKISLFEGEVINYFGTQNIETKYWKKFINRYNMIILAIIVQMWLLTMYFKNQDSTMLNISLEIHSIQQDFHTFIICLAIIILNIIVIFMVKNILISEKEQYQYKIKEKEYANIQQQDKIIRQYKHDLTNHFKVLQILAEDEKYLELKNYLVNYNENINSNSVIVNTGLVELDILLNTKINIAHTKNIITKYKCLSNIKCNNKHIIDLISIIGNVLDNAIEASEKSEKRVINIEIKENTLDYIFIIKNSTNNNEVVSIDMLTKEGYSTKGKGRGIGLSVVSRLVKKYRGSINISNENNRFIIRIHLSKYELEKM